MDNAQNTINQLTAQVAKVDKRIESNEMQLTLIGRVREDKAPQFVDSYITTANRLEELQDRKEQLTRRIIFISALNMGIDFSRSVRH